MKIPSFLQLLFASALIVLVGSCATTSRSGPAALAGTWTNSLGTVWTIKADGTFDVVFARAVLHHMRDLDSACRELFRVLRPGGVLIAAREHVISKETDLEAFFDQHPLHHLYGGEHAFLLDRYIGALRAAGFSAIEVLAPLKSPINLFPYTIETLRTAVVERLASKIPVKPLWRAALASKSVFMSLLSMAERFDHRPGRLYSFVCHKAQT